MEVLEPSGSSSSSKTGRSSRSDTGGVLATATCTLQRQSLSEH